MLSETTTAYEFRADKKDYPLEKILEVAYLAGLRGSDVTKRQISFIDSPDKIIRYWAIIGLKSQRSGDLMPHSDKIINAINDPYPPLAVTASAIAYEVFNSSRAESKLDEFCSDENFYISLMAINYLLYMANKEPFIETIKAVRAVEGQNYSVAAACTDFLGSLGLIPNNPDYRR